MLTFRWVLVLAILAVVVHGNAQEDEEVFKSEKEIFEVLDEDSDGKLGKDELVSSMKKMAAEEGESEEAIQGHEARIRKHFAGSDKDQDGKLDLQEFNVLTGLLNKEERGELYGRCSTEPQKRVAS